MILGSDIVVLLILFSFSGFFSAAEAALLSLTDLHLHKMKTDKYLFLGFVTKLLDNPRRLLITIVTSNEAVNIGISILAASLFISMFGAGGQWISIVVTSGLLFIVGEAIPKTYGVTYPMTVSALVSPLLLLISRLELPVVAALEKAPGLILSKLDRHKSNSKDILTEDEFRHLVDAGSRDGAVDEAQKELINAIFESGDRPVEDIMIPRVDMFCLPSEMKPADILTEVARGRYERIPIYHDERDNIIGILRARDLLENTLSAGVPPSVEKLLIRPYFVPESKTINSLLNDFREKSMQIAIVVDEYGGVAGLVSIEDILEYLFEEAYSEEEPVCVECDVLDKNIIIVPGRLPIDEVNELLGASFPMDEFDTIGGLVLHLFGKMPERGESIRFGDYLLRVEGVRRTKILNVRIEREARSDEEGTG